MGRFCIVLAEQPHRFVFSEVVESLSWGLRELGHAVHTSPRIDGGARNIILAPHLLLASDENVSIPPGTIVYNGEPHCSTLFVRSLRLLSHRNVTAWDYSATNVEFLHKLDVPSRHVPYAWAPTLCRGAPTLCRGLDYVASKIDVDVLFIGSLSPRRVHVLEQLSAKHPELRVQRLFGAYGIERDRWLLRSRICLNMRYWEEETPNEDLRILVACANGVAVVSEGTPDEPAKEHWAKWCAYEDLVEVVAEQVHSGQWKEQASIGFASVQMRDAAMVIQQALEGGNQ